MKTLAHSPLRLGNHVASHEGFDAYSAIHRDQVTQIEAVGVLRLEKAATRLVQYPSELRVTLGGVTDTLVAIDGESDDTYWWSKKTPLVHHAHLIHEGEPRFLMPSRHPRRASHISRDVRYAACELRVASDDHIETTLQVADVAAGHLIPFEADVLGCAAGSRAFAVATAEGFLPAARVRLQVIRPHDRSISAPLPVGRPDLLSLSWCDGLVFHSVDELTVHILDSESFSTLHTLTLAAPAEAMVFFAGLLWVAERGTQRVVAYGIPQGTLSLPTRPEAAPLKRLPAPWHATPRPPNPILFDLGGRTVARTFVDFAPTLIELPDTPLSTLRKQAGDDPARLKTAQRKVRALSKSPETPAKRRRSFAEAAVSSALRLALRGGPSKSPAPQLALAVRSDARAYEGTAWRSEAGTYIARSGKLVPFDDAPAPEGPLQLVHPAELSPEQRSRLIDAGLHPLQRDARVFRAGDLAPRAVRGGSIYVLGTGGFGRTSESWACKQLTRQQLFTPNLFATAHMHCFDRIDDDGILTRWVMDVEHGGGWLEFRRRNGTLHGGETLHPDQLPPRIFSSAVDVITEIYKADYSGIQIKPME